VAHQVEHLKQLLEVQLLLRGHDVKHFVKLVLVPAAHRRGL